MKSEQDYASLLAENKRLKALVDEKQQQIELKQKTIESQQKTIDENKQKVEILEKEYIERISQLEGKIDNLKASLTLKTFQQFGSKSEKLSDREVIKKALLSDGLKDDDPNLAQAINEAEKVVEESKKRNRKQTKSCGRKPIAIDEKTVETKHYESEETTCPRCGSPLFDMNSSEISTYMDLRKQMLGVVRNIVSKKVCKECGYISRGKAPERFIPGGLASDSVIAAAIVDKYVFAMPITRTTKRFRICGFDISDTNFCNWILKAGIELKPLSEEILKHILRGKALNMDETRLQVLDEPGRKDQTKSWIWSISDASGEHKAAYFKYDISRSSNVIADLLKDYNGFVQTDGYVGYQTKKQDFKFIQAMCMAHFRRKVNEALIGGKYKEDSPGYTTLTRIQSYILRLYNIHDVWTKKLQQELITEKEFLKGRKEESVPVFNKLTQWCEGRLDMHETEKLVTTALEYYLNKVPLFMRYLDCPYLSPDNNSVERLIRRIAVLRKNSLFAGCPDGANTLGVLESIINTALLNDLEPYEYMEYLLKKATEFRDLPVSTVDYSQLLPWNLPQGIVTKKKLIMEK